MCCFVPPLLRWRRIIFIEKLLYELWCGLKKAGKERIFNILEWLSSTSFSFSQFLSLEIDTIRYLSTDVPSQANSQGWQLLIALCSSLYHHSSLHALTASYKRFIFSKYHLILIEKITVMFFKSRAIERMRNNLLFQKCVWNEMRML